VLLESRRFAAPSEKTSQGWQLNGRKIFVLDAGIGRRGCSASLDRGKIWPSCLFRADSRDDSYTTPAIDATRKLYDVTLKDVFGRGCANSRHR